MCQTGKSIDFNFTSGTEREKSVKTIETLNSGKMTK